MNPRIAELRLKLQQLQAQHASGALNEATYSAARQALERELVDETLKEPPPPPPRPSGRLWAGLALGVMVVAVAGYSITGSPGRAGLATAPAPAASAAQVAGPSVDGADAPVTDEQVAAIVDRMAQRLKDQPDDAAGWALLARAYSAMGRHGDAIPAFEKAMSLTGEDANLLADYADTLAAQSNGQFSDEALKLVARALVLEPDNIKALALSGSAAFDQRDYATAVRQWDRVQSRLPPDSPIMAQVQSSIAQARELGGLPPAPPSTAQVAASALGAAPPVDKALASPATKPAATAAAIRATAVSGSVSLAPALAAKVSPEDTVFILARPAEGPRMPLAVLRKQVKDLPLQFTLDDSMAMAPTAKISDHAEIIVVARVSKSGDAMPKPGDFSGQSGSVSPGTKGIPIQILDSVGK